MLVSYEKQKWLLSHKFIHWNEISYFCFVWLLRPNKKKNECKLLFGIFYGVFLCFQPFKQESLIINLLCNIELAYLYI